MRGARETSRTDQPSDPTTHAVDPRPQQVLAEELDRHPVEVTLRGNVGEGAAAYADLHLSRALAPLRVRRVRVVLDWHHHPAMACPAEAHASVELGGRRARFVYAEAEAPTMNEAIDDLVGRLRVLVTGEHDRRHDRRRRARR